MKLEREALVQYLDTKFTKAATGASTATWEVIGEDIEEMSTALNPQTSKVKTILGVTKTRDTGYEPTTEATPFYADTDSALYPKIRDIAMKRQKGDACKTIMLEVIIEDTDDTTHTAYVQEVMVKPTSYGGNTEGLNFPFTIEEDGKRVAGTVTAESVASGVPVFTATT